MTPTKFLQRTGWMSFSHKRWLAKLAETHAPANVSDRGCGSAPFVVGESRCADLVDVGFGKFTDAVERVLQLLLIAFELGVGRILGHRNEFAEAQQHTRKGLRDDQSVPGSKHPRSVDRHMKHGHRNAGGARQRNRSGFHLVAWATRTVESKSHRPTFLQRTSESEQGAHGVAAAGAFNRDESKFANDAPHVFAIVTVATHYPDAKIAEKIAGGNLAGVPEGGDQRALPRSLLSTFLAREADSQRRAQQADDSVSRKNDDTQNDSLAEGEAVGRCSRGGGRAFARAGFRHQLILTVCAYVFDGRQNCLLDAQSGTPAQRADAGAVEQDKRTITHPSTLAAGICDFGMKVQMLANPADGVVDLAVIVGAEIKDVDLAMRLLEGNKNRVDAILYVQI